MCGNAVDKLYMLKANKDWTIAVVEKVGNATGYFTTAVVLIDGKPYVLTGVNGFIPPSNYTIEKIKLDRVSISYSKYRSLLGRNLTEDDLILDEISCSSRKISIFKYLLDYFIYSI